MKKLLLTTLLAVTIVIANAQSDRIFKSFKFDISAGYALPISNSGVNGGFLNSFEPKYAVSDQISVGLKAETAISITGDENTGNVKGSDDIKGSTRFSYAPRLGVEIAHFQAAFEYNFAGKVEVINKNYLGIKMGV